MKKLVILGGGESGVGAAILGKKEGYQVFLSDRGVLKDNYKRILDEHQIEYEFAHHTEAKIMSADLVVKSPGIPENVPLIMALKAKQIEVISEIEFASRFTESKIIAITGSNGKTTTTSLMYHIMKEAGLDVGLCGNIGKSFAQLVAEDPHEYYVIEISSFQLDDIRFFKPYIAIILNITPDHLDRYENNFDKYAHSKFRITENQTDKEYFVYNVDDEKINELIKELKIKANKTSFSMKDKKQKAYANEKIFEIKDNDNSFLMPIADLGLIGKHNVSNSLAAATAANILKIRKDVIKRSLSDFKSVEHRLENVLKIGGIEFINDSKATNVNATYFALESMKNPVIWIVGGTDKGNDYSELMPFVKKKVKAIVCLGVDNHKIIEAFSGVVEKITETKTMKDAVRAAYMYGEKGDTVLLSPACASFDLFTSYQDRGNQFKKEVKEL
ncbi:MULTISPECIES: UDP-N-acetylmuramoyl-L-alanine--D-glutamate ligase [Weeksella]|uniref:UDP-N-acetylmuramoylalanine--D-glutamate ligase n=1 Tax=Weeksella virosa (strain ATCC 43766 / DSM 16922 / JCM 21250 / CCUG 30538 / CDC 9751 / IAM 14551 / NBRC 16016 / NCTC 11634 / CL345/78) TaxID=865938 RepID=F0P054_WEEVC|nr:MULTISPECIES: UDP-N-acetylmuramoyl-L-alanine--D-glutamate ligase [Weeksella]ADX67401.1 UDP-N-acetylmuramoylalanine--D-glutamate ligase [Weeksella virosa DSM 16922]OFM81959.1 UDP-N-acetylmuramoylalanine--D-glutamate ligase [Weeksella sp. HMSC059D05]SUP53692.1 UDP-N-acetylmuramoylalanine--D-glutamate ligase [Weeksella virosa]VEH62858.1 UDP-N-acetylmuramoylalanine--D-glutamate ligase [Weeksella virosa]